MLTSDIAATLPGEPGVYLFKGAAGEILYIGKARNLRTRVRSYFLKTQMPKTRLLMRRAQTLEHIIVNNETEALILENRLIKKHLPRYNISLKDAKTYAYLRLTNEPHPRLLTVRHTRGSGQFFGPYVDGRLRHELSSLAIKLFKLRVCNKMPKKACLNYHIGLCSAPCIGAIAQEQYAKSARDAARFLGGDVAFIQTRLAAEMKEASNAMRYEIALEKKTQLAALEMLALHQTIETRRRFDSDALAFAVGRASVRVSMFSMTRGVLQGKSEFEIPCDIEPALQAISNFLALYYSHHPVPSEILVNMPVWHDSAGKVALEKYLQTFRTSRVRLHVPTHGAGRELVLLAEKNLAPHREHALDRLASALMLPATPRIIEAFDASNLGPDQLVGAMTRWVDGVHDRSGQRRFRIKSFSGMNDDFAAIHEIVRRRYTRLARERAQMPDLILIDGGPGQLSSALSALREVGLQIPIISLAKGEELIYLPGQQEPVRLSRTSAELLQLIAIRDSVHRAALAYNRKRRTLERPM